MPTDWAAFKPPSLRNVTKSAPYFHDGSVAKLEEAVTKLMASGGIKNKNLKSALSEDAAAHRCRDRRPGAVPRCARLPGQARGAEAPVSQRRASST
jgi:cytochrome c peroxidase